MIHERDKIFGVRRLDGALVRRCLSEAKAPSSRRTPRRGLFQHAGEFFEVVDEAAMFEPASFIIRGPED